MSVLPIEKEIQDQMKSFNCDRSKLLEIYKSERDIYQAEMEKYLEYMKLCMANINQSIEHIELDNLDSSYSDIEKLKKEAIELDEYADSYASDKEGLDDMNKLIEYLEEFQ